MDRYVYVRSDESNGIFDDNQVYKFKIHLKVPLSFHGFWKVALTEFQARNAKGIRKSKSNSAIYILSSICKDSIAHGVELPLLRRVEMNTPTGWDYIFPSPYYVPLKQRELQEFEVVIKSNDGNLATFLESPLYLTLHFKQYPFFTDYESL